MTSSLLAERVQALFETRQVIYFPVLVTVVVSVARRDAGYLLGWAVTAPWFLINLVALDPGKGSFSAYTSFPFMPAMFWVYVYGSRLAPAERRLRPRVLEAVFALVCFVSTLGLYLGEPSMLTANLKDMTYHRPMNRAAVHGFVEALDSHRAAFGRLQVDPPVAALALEHLELANAWHPAAPPADAIAFHRSTWVANELAAALFANRLESCTRILETRLVVCSRGPLPANTFANVATEVVPTVFAFLRDAPGVRVGSQGVFVERGAIADGRLGILPPGRYALTWTVDADTAIPAHATELARLEIVRGKAVTAAVTLYGGAREVLVPFVSDGVGSLGYRFTSTAPGPLTVIMARLERAP